MNKLLMLMAVLALLFLPVVLADMAGINQTVSDEDKAKFDAILAPVMKIYNFMKYIASAVALLFLIYAGISYMMAGSDPSQKEKSKNVIMYVVIGMVIIWVAPLIVELLVS